jgi:sugar phosphate isomerase/epimerase
MTGATMRLGLEAGEHTLDLAVQHGIKGVPIWIDQLANEGVRSTLEPLQERGLQACQIGAFGYNPLSPDQAEQDRQTQMLHKIIPMAADTGCPYIVICGGNHHPSGFGAADARNFTTQAIDQIAQKLEPIVKLAEQHGAKISIEAYLKTAINSPETFKALWQKMGSDALCVNVDVTSLYDVRDTWNPSATIDHICNGLAGHYGLGHIKDVKLEEGFHVHMGLGPLGSSATDWAQVLQRMNPHMPTDSWVILEHVSSPEEAEASLKVLRDSAKRAGVTLE